MTVEILADLNDWQFTITYYSSETIKRHRIGAVFLLPLIGVWL